ncbi:MAG: gliding motility protein GldN [Bacteroidota bacterium]
MKRFVFALGVLIVGLGPVAAQEEVAPLIKPSVPQSYELFKKMVWRRMDMKEKQNRPFFSLNGEVSRLLIEAVDEGLLRPYRSDSCINFMPDIVFVSNISVEREDNPFVGGGFSSFGAEPQEQETTEPDGPLLDAIPPELFSVLYVREEVVFDRNRSRMYTYIKSLSLFLPASAGSDWNPGGFEKPIAHFKYDEVVDLFKNQYSDRAVWYNVQNEAANLNFADAFELRLFHAPIVRLSNPQNLDIRQEYAEEAAQDPLAPLIYQQKYEYDLMEYESELWEY